MGCLLLPQSHPYSVSPFIDSAFFKLVWRLPYCDVPACISLLSSPCSSHARVPGSLVYNPSNVCQGGLVHCQCKHNYVNRTRNHVTLSPTDSNGENKSLRTTLEVAFGNGVESLQ